jgi:kynureninase
LSLRVREGAEALHAELSRRAVYCDFRRPDVVRVAPVPLYNSFEDTWRFAQIVREHTE